MAWCVCISCRIGLRPGHSWLLYQVAAENQQHCIFLPPPPRDGGTSLLLATNLPNALSYQWMLCILVVLVLLYLGRWGKVEFWFSCRVSYLFRWDLCSLHLSSTRYYWDHGRGWSLPNPKWFKFVSNEKYKANTKPDGTGCPLGMSWANQDDVPYWELKAQQMDCIGKSCFTPVVT